MIVLLFLFLSFFLFLVALRKGYEEKRDELQARISGERSADDTLPHGRKLRSPLTVAMDLAEQSRIKITRQGMLILLSACAAGGALFAFLKGAGLLGTGFAAIAGTAAPILFLNWKKNRYKQAFRYGLQELTEYGISVFKITPDIDAMLQEVVDNSKNQILVKECQEILFEANVLKEPAVKVMKKRAVGSGISEYELLVKMTNVANDTDSSLVKIYSDMNKSIRRYFGTEKKIAAKTSGMRNLGYALAFLPVPMFGFFWDSIQPHLVGGMKLFFFLICGIIGLGVYALFKAVNIRI